MQSSIEEKIKSDIRSGKDPASVKLYLNRQQLDQEVTQYFVDLLDDEIAVHELRKVKTRDANLIVYMGYFFMAIAVFFGIYNLGFGVAIFVVGFIVTRRGRSQLAAAAAIDSIEELLPDYPTKFHKRRI